MVDFKEYIDAHRDAGLLVIRGRRARKRITLAELRRMRHAREIRAEARRKRLEIVRRIYGEQERTGI